MRKFIRIFPVVITTNVSAHLLGAPRPYFDLTIIDEASQCSNAVSLIPIIRGENLLLVGDPQQLNPVIVLDPNINRELIKKYTIPSEYDYIENSIYKTYLAVDAISDEILLSYHYRCNKKIIDFNNKKYYNNKLVVKSESQCDTPLIFIDTPSLAHEGRNTSLPEANEIIAFIKENPGKKIGVITPFVKQKELINDLLRENEISDITCGTVHAFQGDEKDIILFSTAITAKTQQKTYDWLKNNKELINVATSRAKDQLVLLTSKLELDRLNAEQQPNDFWELCEYVRNKGESHVSVNGSQSRALGFKPYGTDIEMAFHDNLNQALGITNSRCVLRKEVPISLVFPKLEEVNDIFYTGRFDFVVYGKTAENREYPLFAIELNGIEHETDERVIARDEKKKEICKKYNFKLISIKNTFARRYNHIKDILMEYFQKK